MILCITELFLLPYKCLKRYLEVVRIEITWWGRYRRSIQFTEMPIPRPFHPIISSLITVLKYPSTQSTLIGETNVSAVPNPYPNPNPCQRINQVKCCNFQIASYMTDIDIAFLFKWCFTQRIFYSLKYCSTWMAAYLHTMDKYLNASIADFPCVDFPFAQIYTSSVRVLILLLSLTGMICYHMH